MLCLSCSPAKRFTKDEETKKVTETTVNSSNSKESETEFVLNEIRVSMQGIIPSESLIIGSSVNLYNDKNKIALINEGNKIDCYPEDGIIILTIDDQSFEGEMFFLTPAESEEIIKLNGKRYRGKIQVSLSNNSIEIINILNLEDYVKGVLAKEMPIGKNQENLEALKALAVCVKTYAIQKMKNGKMYFDIYADTRDQVYGGVDAESPITNEAADQTNNLILKYEENPATIFYHSTCGGYTESSKNVFTKEEIPYLVSIEDGDSPYCKISPKFEWKEVYQPELIISRLKDYSLLDDQFYELKDILINTRFQSGRVDELEIIVADENENTKQIIIKGNEIRSVLRTANGKSILWSTMFEISNNSESIILSGKGFGHGVGLCQWGAIALSHEGWNYRDILYHYYPGTNVEKLNDKN